MDLSDPELPMNMGPSIKIVQAPRRAGKTTACIDWWLQDPGHRVILTHDMQSATHVIHHIRRLVAETLAPAPAQALLQQYRLEHHVLPYDAMLSSTTSGLFFQEVMIDQADMVLAKIFHNHLVKGVTWDL